MESDKVRVLAGVGVTLVGLPLLLSYLSSRRRIRIKKSIDKVLQSKKELFDVKLDLKSVPFDTISNLSASQLVEQLQLGKLTAEEVITHFIQVAKYAHNKYNCLTDTMFKEALEQARNLDYIFKTTGKTVGLPFFLFTSPFFGRKLIKNLKIFFLGPLHGLPVSIKDNISVKGTDCTLGALKYCNQPRGIFSHN